jgi:hypothetical protein
LHFVVRVILLKFFVVYNVLSSLKVYSSS